MEEFAEEFAKVDVSFWNNSFATIDGTNKTEQINQGYDDESMRLIEAMRLLRNIWIPVVSLIGLVGNSLSLVVFSAKSMKQSSCSVFLAALAFVDNVFLLSLLVTWIDMEYIPLLRFDFACQLLIFCTYVCSFLSVWFIVGFTVERFIAICFPLRNNYMCSIFREKVAVSVLSLLACGFYNFSFWTTGLQKMGPSLRCYHKMEFFAFLEVATWIDTVVTMVLPFFIIVIVNSIVLRTVLKCAKQAKPTPKSISPSHQMLQQNNCQSPSTTRFIRLKKLTKIRSNPQLRVTRTLLLVSTTFLCLNLPSHAMRLYTLVISIATPQQSEISMLYRFVQEITLMLYYATFSCNFILYTAFGRNFQNSLKEIIRCRSSMTYHREQMLQRFSSTRAGIETSL